MNRIGHPRLLSYVQTWQSLLLLLSLFISPLTEAMAPKPNWNVAIERTIKRYGFPIEPKLKALFINNGLTYPPKDIALLAFKSEHEVQLWAKDAHTPWKHINNYPLTAYSGKLGPKLKENDRQIPEGIYRLTSFNPYSQMHLSMMINYPNHFDKMHAISEGRDKLGNNIFIHGKSISVGCLAVGDKAIDELFLLAYRVGLGHIKLIIAPNDLRKHKPATAMFAQPHWVSELYKDITRELRQFNNQQYAQLK